jgi:hypothetical protein
LIHRIMPFVKPRPAQEIVPVPAEGGLI